MIAPRTWIRVLFVAMTNLLISSAAFASRTTATFRTTEIATNSSSQPREPAGSPELGILIIIGVIAFLVFVAWVFSRIGEGHSRPVDNTMN